jgi:hypothetical protein
MVGQLKIAELRKRAEQELGPKFDVRDFHKAARSQGALPLAVPTPTATCQKANPAAAHVVSLPVAT